MLRLCVEQEENTPKLPCTCDSKFYTSLCTTLSYLPPFFSTVFISASFHSSPCFTFFFLLPLSPSHSTLISHPLSIYTTSSKIASKQHTLPPPPLTSPLLNLECDVGSMGDSKNFDATSDDPSSGLSENELELMQVRTTLNFIALYHFLLCLTSFSLNVFQRHLSSFRCISFHFI